MYQRFSNVILVRNHERQPIFLRCSLLEPVVSFNPKPTWTCKLEEAEQLSGDRQHLLAIASRYDAIPVSNYGTPQQICLAPIDLVNRVLDYDGCQWGVIESVARPLAGNERGSELYTVENLKKPFEVCRFPAEELHQAVLDGRARTVGWRGTAGPEIPIELPQSERD